jgi:hypothetical protein
MGEDITHVKTPIATALLRDCNIISKRFGKKPGDNIIPRPPPGYKLLSNK